MIRILCIGVCLFSVSCATIHSGNYAESTNAADPENKLMSSTGMVISGEENNDLTSKYFTSIDFTFENKTDKWIYVKSVKVDFGDDKINGEVKIPVGADLMAWAEASQQRAAISNHNTNLVLGSIAAMGTVAAAGSRDANTQKLGSLGAISAASALTVRSYQSQLNDLEKAKLVPDSHLLAQNFIVPPGLHSKRWITFYTQNPFKIPYVHQIFLEIETADGQKDRLQLKLRGDYSLSDWQRGHPDMKKMHRP